MTTKSRVGPEFDRGSGKDSHKENLLEQLMTFNMNYVLDNTFVSLEFFDFQHCTLWKITSLFLRNTYGSI